MTDFFDDAATLDALFDIPGLDAAIEEAESGAGLGPKIPAGIFLAVVTGVEPKHNEATGSYGFFWDLTVNLGSFADGWNPNTSTETIRHYTWLGRMVDGRVVPGDKGYGFATINMLRALNLRAGADAKDAVGRIIKVKIKHAPGRDNPDTLFAEVEKTWPYTDPVTGEVAPRINGGASGEDAPF